MKPQNKPRKKRDKIDPLLVYARRFRSNLRARAKKNDMDPDEVEAARVIYNWLKSQEPLKCYYTNEPLALKDLNIDHKTPLNLGGTNKLENLCVTSSRTNRIKGSFTEQEFKRLLKVFKTNESAKDYLMSRLLRGYMVGRK